MKIGLRLSLSKQKKPVESKLLDQYPGATAAYSLRYVTSSYVGEDVILVRRSSDNAKLGFTPAEITDGTLLSWVGGGDGFIATWYDQTQSGRDVTQPTTTKQPAIVISGSLVTDVSGKPALDFSLGDPVNLQSSAETISTGISVFIVMSLDDKSEALPYPYGQGGGAGQYGIGMVASSNTVRQLISGSVVSAVDGNYNARSLYTFILDSSNGVIQRNSTVLSTGTVATQTSGSHAVRIGNAVGSPGFQANGLISELIRYDTNQSANRTAIETAINSYYNIY